MNSGRADRNIRSNKFRCLCVWWSWMTLHLSCCRLSIKARCRKSLLPWPARLKLRWAGDIQKCHVNHHVNLDKSPAAGPLAHKSWHLVGASIIWHRERPRQRWDPQIRRPKEILASWRQNRRMKDLVETLSNLSNAIRCKKIFGTGAGGGKRNREAKEERLNSPSE